jgi:YVTN family beta-propeller protein
MVPLAQGRQRLLLAVLLVHANETLASDHLIDALWGEAPPASAGSSLHNLVSGLRKGLGDGRLATSGHGYALRVADGELDLQLFDALVASGRAAATGGDPERAAALLREALELWRGPPLGELAYHPALASEAARLEEARLAALEVRIEADLACGRHAELVAELEALTREHPLRERLCAQQMLALYRAGRQADALAAYRDARERLVEELGVEPGPALRRLERAVLEQDPALGAPDALPAPPPALAWVRRHAGVLLGTGVILVAAALVAIIAAGGNEPPRTAAGATPDVLAAIDPATNRITRRFPVGDTPTVVAVGAGGAWTINADGRTISRVDLRTKAVETRSPGANPLDIAAGRDASWLIASAKVPRPGRLEYPRPDTLAELDPVSGAPVASLDLAASSAPPYEGSPPQSVAVDGDAVWAIGPTGWLQRVDLRSRRSLILLRSLTARRVATGDGQVWVLLGPIDGKPDAANLLRLAPRSGRVIARVRVPSNSLRTIAVGAGAVWLTDDFAGGVWRVDPRGGSDPVVIAIDQGVDSVAAADDAVWTANSVSGTIARIDPATNRVVNKLEIGGAPRGIAIGAGRVWVTVAGAGHSVAAAKSLRPNARIKPVASRDCGRVLTGPVGDADLLIASDEALEGFSRPTGAAANAAVAFVLRERGFRAGRFRLALQACNNALAQTGGTDEHKCRAHARAYARNERLIGVVGPAPSGCTEVMLPILNRAPSGPVSLVSTINSRVDLVRRNPAWPADRLHELYPTGQRGYARMIPSDDYEAAAGALFAQRLSPDGAFVVQDPWQASLDFGNFFRTAARRIGLPILGNVTRDEGAPGESRLARRIRASGARAVYIHGISTDIRRLRAALGPDVTLIFSTMAFPFAFLFDRFGPAARGVYMTISTPPPAERLSPAGQRFLRNFAATRPGGQIPKYALYAAAATDVLLDAIARSDGTRESVAQALSTVRGVDTPLGPITLDLNGELTRNPVAIVRADHGGEPIDPQGTEGGVVVDVITPPARLVTK